MTSNVLRSSPAETVEIQRLEAENAPELYALAVANSTRLVANFPGLKLYNFSVCTLAKAFGNPGESEHYGIFDTEELEQPLIGYIGLHALRGPRHYLEYWIDRCHEGEGKTTAAVGQLLVASQTAKTEPIYAEVERTNHASQRVLAKNNFTKLWIPRKYIHLPNSD